MTNQATLDDWLLDSVLVARDVSLALKSRVCCDCRNAILLDLFCATDQYGGTLHKNQVDDRIDRRNAKTPTPLAQPSHDDVVDRGDRRAFGVEDQSCPRPAPGGGGD